jgi:hypothetical protein
MPGALGRPRSAIHRRTALFVAIVFSVGFAAAFFTVEAQTVRSNGTPPALQAVLADAASRPGADTRDVQVQRAEPREWSDSGLGCPQPDQLYAQVMTPGWIIEVRSGGKTFEYHTDSGTSFVLCGQR